MRTLDTRRGSESGFTMIELLISTVVLGIVLGMVSSILVMTQQNYLEQRELLDIQTNAVTTLDQMVRLIRMAGSNPQDISLTPLDPDPDNNDVFDSIHIQADWNPADGALDDDYEDVTFTTSNDVLMIQEPSDTSAVPFLEGINAIAFTFLDSTGAAIADPETNVNDIVLVRITLTAETVGTDTMVFNSSAAIRSRLN